MKKKLYIQNTKPFIELMVKPEGSEQEAVTFGFKVYGLKDREKLSEELTEFLENFSEEVAALAATQTETFNDLSDVEKENTINKALSFMAEQDKFNLAKAIDSILYIKGATVTVYDAENVLTSSKIEDTRTAQPLEDFWTTPEEALQVILESFLDDKGWKDAILLKHQEALAADYSVERSKN